MSYTRAMLYLSLNFPRLWRLRLDLVLLLGAFLYAFTAVLLQALNIIEPGSVLGRTMIGLIVSLASLAATGFWLYAISKAMRLREIIKEKNHPSFAAIFLISGVLLWPILWVLYPVMALTLAQIAAATQARIPPAQVINTESASLTMVALMYWFLFLLSGAMFVKSLLLSSSMWALGAWVLNVF